MTEKQLNSRDRELVALGASIASNCIPCVKYHISECRNAGLSDGEIQEAMGIADMVRQVPARKVLGTARAMLGLSESDNPSNRGAGEKSCCENMQANSDPQVDQERDFCNMLEMMKRCGPEMMRRMKEKMEEFYSPPGEDRRDDKTRDKGSCQG